LSGEVKVNIFKSFPVQCQFREMNRNCARTCIHCGTNSSERYISSRFTKLRNERGEGARRDSVLGVKGNFNFQGTAQKYVESHRL